MNKPVTTLLFISIILLFSLQTTKSENNAKILIEIFQDDTNNGFHVENHVYLDSLSINNIPASIKTDFTSGDSVIIDNIAGELLNALTLFDLKSIKVLTITGTMDARDFKTMKDSITNLSVLDFSRATILEYTGNEGTIENTSMTYPANEIPSYAFGNKSYLKINEKLYSIYMSNTTLSIGANAFQYCRNLTSANIAPSVITIGKSAFFSCKSLTSMLIPASVKTIGESAFLGVHCSIDVETENTAFSGTDGILFDKNLTTLIKYPVNKTGSYTIPSTVNNISNLAFFGCNNLTDVTIYQSVTNLGNQAFSYCQGLKSVYIPSSVTTMGNSVFLGSSCLINVDENNINFSSEDGILFNKTKTTLIQCPGSVSGIYNIPASVTKIGYMAFMDCIYLTSVFIPDSIKNISYAAFKNCTGLISFIIPESVKTIESSAFYNCKNLSSLNVFSHAPIELSNSTDVFYNINKSYCLLFVLAGTKFQYQQANQWGDFTNIFEMTTGFITQKPGDIKIKIKDQSLVILNALIGSKLIIYSFNGTKIKEQPVNEYQTQITLPSGDYILQIGKYSKKIKI